jgi:hypothetical protein
MNTRIVFSLTVLTMAFRFSNQPDLFRDLLHPRPHLAPLGKEIVIGIDEQQAGSGGIITRLSGHASNLHLLYECAPRHVNLQIHSGD